MDDSGWDLYRGLAAVLEAGSLSGAARALGLTQPTVGRQIAELERTVGTALFTRSPQGLRATNTALAMAPHAQAMAMAAASLKRASSGDASGVTGTIRVTASEIVGAEVLPPILTKLRDQYPELVVELALSNAVGDLLRGAADIAVRMTAPQQDALVARRVGDVHLGLYALKDYAAKYGLPLDIEALRSHALIGFDRETPFLRELGTRLGVNRDMFAFRSDSDLAQLAAIRAGFGIGFAQRGIGARQQDLVPILHEQVGFDLPMWVVMHEDLRQVTRIRIAFDALAAGLAEYASDDASRQKLVGP